MNNELKATCSYCRKEFTANPDSFVEYECTCCDEGGAMPFCDDCIKNVLIDEDDEGKNQ